ncbi:hypothetical protein RF11_07856 [Thelohanellus kitauei]|uniref:CBS domain-containing protein n=1 Tax=Thelohanellus kitauei TaxID=669202 RepID=A0A0C2J270_THEKT|nr:hypothetical protein RF11_07856 [Thelohanellus kitauei]
MEEPICQLECDFVKPCEISSGLERVFELLDQDFDIQIPVVEDENFVGCFDVSFMVKFIEGHLPKGSNEVRRYVNREVKKVFIGESKLFHLHYMFKTSTNVFVLEKKQSLGETILKYKGQISKNSFYKQILKRIKADNVSADFLTNILRNRK